MQNTLTLPSLAAVAPRPSPLEDWQKLLTHLLEHHYGLSISDTPFSDDAVIQEHIDRALSPMDAINYIVERYALVRTDRTGFSVTEQEPYLTPLDILRARHATGLSRVAFPTAPIGPLTSCVRGIRYAGES